MGSTPSIAYWAFAAIGFTALAYKVRDIWRSPGRPLAWGVCVAIFCASTALFLSAPVVVGFLDHAFGVPNLTTLVVYCLAVGLTVSVLILVTYWRDPEAHAWSLIRWWLLGAGTTVAALIVLFVLGDAPVTRLVDFSTYYARTPYIRELLVLYVAMHAAATIWIATDCWRGSRQVGRPWLRRGLRGIMAGCALGLAYDACRLGPVVARWFGGNIDDVGNIAPRLAGVATVVLAASFTAPLWGPQTSRYRAYRELGPLWRALRTATPQIVRAVPLPWWDLELKLARRRTEIQDGRLALRPFLDPAVAKAAVNSARRKGLTGTDQQAYVEAACLRSAIKAKGSGLRHVPSGTESDGDRAPRVDEGVSELDWLVNVARSFARRRTDDTVESVHRQAADDVRCA